MFTVMKFFLLPNAMGSKHFVIKLYVIYNHKLLIILYNFYLNSTLTNLNPKI